MPYFFIFGSIVLIINIKRGWLNPFSNTIGYLISMILLKGGKSFNTIATILKNGGNDEQKSLIEKICSDKSLVTNELSGDNYAKAMKALFPNIQEHIGAAVDSSPPSNDSDDDSKENDEGNSGDEGSEGGQNNDLTKAYNYLFRMVLLKDIIANITRYCTESIR